MEARQSVLLDDMLRGVELCIFDVDGTLLDSMPFWRELDERFLASRGLEGTADYYEALRHLRLAEAAEYTRTYYHLEESRESIIGAWMGLARSAFAGEIGLKPGVLEILAELRRRGLTCCVLTANERALVDLAFARHGIADYFRHCYIASEEAWPKTEAELWRSLVEREGRELGSCLVFEDSLYSLRAAQRAGLRVAAIYEASAEATWAQVCAEADWSFVDYRELMLQAPCPGSPSQL